MPPPDRTLWTIGHSIRPWEAFTAMLAEAGIERLADVRRFAGSRRHPQYAAVHMAQALEAVGIVYLPLPALGGRRAPHRESPNTAWRSEAFRGYADHMATDEYRDARDRLAAVARTHRTAMMCAEALWWECHRGLLSDDFKAAGWDVVHLLAPGRSESHPYTSAARIVEGRLDYSLPPEQQPELF